MDNKFIKNLLGKPIEYLINLFHSGTSIQFNMDGAMLDTNDIESLMTSLFYFDYLKISYINI